MRPIVGQIRSGVGGGGSGVWKQSDTQGVGRWGWIKWNVRNIKTKRDTQGFGGGVGMTGYVRNIKTKSDTQGAGGGGGDDRGCHKHKDKE